MTDTLRRLAEYLERSRQLKGTVINAMIYPAILIALVILALVTLMVYVVPNFEPIFTELGDNLPLITKVVLAIAGVLQGFWWLILVGIARSWSLAVREQLSAVASACGLDADELKARVHAGEPMEAVAAECGVDAKQVVHESIRRSRNRWLRFLSRRTNWDALEDP